MRATRNNQPLGERIGWPAERQRKKRKNASCSASWAVSRSIAGKVGEPGLAHYAASKFAVVGFTQALAREIACHDITVNAVCPGVVATPMIDELAKGWGMSIEAMVGKQAIHRAQTPDEVAAAVMFLHANRSITGQALNVDGGTVFS